MSEWDKWRLDVTFVAVLVFAVNNWCTYYTTERLKDQITQLKKELHDVRRVRTAESDSMSE